MAASPWDARLRSAGLRSTAPRRAVLDALDQLGHATVDELATHVERTRPEISLSTVYRTVQVLDEVGLVSHAHLHHGAPTYHSVDDDPHLHLVCAVCGAVQQAPVGLVDAMVDAVARTAAFEVDVRHLVLHGRCAGCAAGSTQATSALTLS